MIILDIPEATPSVNHFHGTHWSRKHKMRKLWTRHIWAARASAYPGRQLIAPDPAKVTIERHGKRLLDPDNLTAGCKWTLDSLKENGLIVDDSPAHLELVVRQRLAKVPRTVITVEAA